MLSFILVQKMAWFLPFLVWAYVSTVSLTGFTQKALLWPGKSYKIFCPFLLLLFMNLGALSEAGSNLILDFLFIYSGKKHFCKFIWSSIKFLITKWCQIIYNSVCRNGFCNYFSKKCVLNVNVIAFLSCTEALMIKFVDALGLYYWLLWC